MEPLDDDLLARLADAEPATRRCGELIQSLSELRARVDGMRDQVPGERDNANFPQRITAFCSAGILKSYGVKPTRGNEAKPSLFEEVASSLFEAATGEAEANLSRGLQGYNRRKIYLLIPSTRTDLVGFWKLSVRCFSLAVVIDPSHVHINSDGDHGNQSVNDPRIL